MPSLRANTTSFEPTAAGLKQVASTIITLPEITLRTRDAHKLRGRPAEIR